MPSPPYSSGSRAPIAFRLAPFSTTTCMAASLLRYQRLQGRAGVLVRYGRDHRLPRPLEEHEDALALLVTFEGGPGRVGIRSHGPRPQDLFHRVGGLAGETQRGEEPERDRVAVAHAITGPRLQRVRERVPEVEDRATPLRLVRIRQNDARLERGAGPNHFLVGEAPDLAPHEQPCLDDLGHSRAPLLVRERPQIPRLDEDAPRKVEGPDEILAVGRVDAGLAADRGVDHPGESRRNRRPAQAALVGRRREPGHIRRRATADRDDHPVAAELEVAPESLYDGGGLRLFAGRHRDDPAALVERVQGEDLLV